jgi:hypothetical protein
MAAEAMELTVGRGNVVAVIKKHNPLGDTKVWFVNDGSKLHYLHYFLCILWNPHASSSSSSSS